MTDEKKLSDAGNNRSPGQASSDRATVRLTVNVTFNLNGELPGVARDVLIRMIDRAIVAGPLGGEADVSVVEHEFELAEVLLSRAGGSPDTDFSQLLDL